MIRDKRNLEPGWCRALGQIAHTIGVLAKVIAHNMKEAVRLVETEQQTPAHTSDQSEQSDTPQVGTTSASDESPSAALTNPPAHLRRQ